MIPSLGKRARPGLNQGSADLQSVALEADHVLGHAKQPALEPTLPAGMAWPL